MVARRGEWGLLRVQDVPPGITELVLMSTEDNGALSDTF